MSDAKKFYTSIPLSQEERLRRKATRDLVIPVRLTNNYAFHRVFKKPEVCKGFLMALLHLTEEEIQSLEVSDPFQEGEDYQKLEICIHVGILDFTLLTSPGFHHHIQLLDNKTHELYSDKFQIHVIELSKLNDPFPKEDQELYHWAKMIAAENLEVMQMEIQNDPNRQLVFDEAKYISLDPTQRYIYLREFLADWDKRSQLRSARDLGLAEGKAEGELYRLLSLIQKKVQKGKSLAQTAEELEDTQENLRLFYEAVQKNPEDTVEQLAERLMKKEIL